MNMLKRLTGVLLAVLLGLNSLSALAEAAEETTLPVQQETALEEVMQEQPAQEEAADAEETQLPQEAETADTPAEEQPAEEAEDKMPLGQDDLFVLGELERRQQEQQAEFELATADGSQYADFYFGGVQVLYGITSSVGLYANIPDYAVPTSAVLRLNYSASDLIISEISALTFYMNGTPFHSVSIVNDVAGGQNVLYIEVPTELMNSGYNLLEVLCYARLTDTEGCTDDYNGANWVKLEESTCLRVCYEIAENAQELAMYPYPFLSLMDASGAQCAVAVPDAAENDEVSAALMLVAGLGSRLVEKNELLFTTIDQCDRDHVIYVGMARNTPAELLGLLDQVVPPTGALIQRVQAGEKEYLLIVSNEEAALLEAVRLLSDPLRAEQLHSTTAYVSVGDAQTFIDAADVSSLALEGQYTFKDVLGHGASFTGPFQQVVTMYLPVAADYTLSSESRFSFNIRYSENLDFDRSLMTVYWGSDIPLHSRKLTKEGAAGETVTFSVPADAIGASGTYMTIVFDLEIKELDCTVRSMNTPWAYITEDSTLYLPQGENTALSLSNRPAPFQSQSRLNNVLLILPDDMQADEMNLAGRLLAMLGSGSNPYGTLSVIRASQFDSAAHQDCNLIAVGRGAGNPFLKAVNEHLYFQFDNDMSSFLSNSKLIMNDRFATETGTLQLLTSPYAADRALLVAAAPGESGIRALTAQVSEEVKRWSLTRDAVVVDSYGKASSYQFKAISDAQAVTAAKPTFTQVVVENREPMMMLLIGMGSMALLLLGAVIVLIRAGRRRKNQE